MVLKLDPLQPCFRQEYLRKRGRIMHYTGNDNNSACSGFLHCCATNYPNHHPQWVFCYLYTFNMVERAYLRPLQDRHNLSTNRLFQRHPLQPTLCSPPPQYYIITALGYFMLHVVAHCSGDGYTTPTRRVCSVEHMGSLNRTGIGIIIIIIASLVNDKEMGKFKSSASL